MISNALRKRKMGQVLKTLREKSYISRSALTHLTGISGSTICRIENGRANIQAYSFDRVCMFFEIYPEDLLDLSPEVISEIARKKRLNPYIIDGNADQNAGIMVVESQASFLKHTRIIELLVNEGHLNKFKRVSEIKQLILDNYQKSIPSSVISNALKSNKNIKCVQPAKKNYKLYKAVRIFKPKTCK
jgi:transcriptional regulator with XRE-family HTH domain